MVMKETMIFLLSCVLGAGFGAFYDLFRIIRLVFPHNKSITFIEDIFYFMLLSIVSFAFLLSQTNGVLRGFTLIGELLGAILYFFTLSIVIMKSANAIILFVKRVFGFLFKITVLPFLSIFKWLFCKISNFFKFCFKKFLIKRNNT